MFVSTYRKQCVACCSIEWEPEEKPYIEKQCVEGSSAITMTLGKPLTLDTSDE